MNVIQTAWQKYRARKSTLGIVTDFLFLVIVLVFVIPPLRFGATVQIARLTLHEPNPIDDIYYLGEDKTLTLKNISGTDTTILRQTDRPVIINFGCVTNPQSCAELKSLNKLSAGFAGRLDVYFITDDDTAAVRRYFGRHRYTIKPLFYEPQYFDANDHELFHELQASLPASLLIAPNRRIVIKKFGAAKWTGKNIEAIVDSVAR